MDSTRWEEASIQMLVEYSMLEQVVSGKDVLVVLLDHGGRSLAGLHAAVVEQYHQLVFT